jgi:excisionase family DNA binding protein
VTTTDQLTKRSDAAEAPQKKDRSKAALPKVEGGLLDTNEAASLLGVSRRTFQGVIHDRKVAKITIGRSVRFHRDDLQAFIDNNRVKAIGWKGSK